MIMKMLTKLVRMDQKNTNIHIVWVSEGKEKKSEN